MAEGGEPERFCATARAHRPDCEYFADGGGVGEFDSLQEDHPPADAALMFDDLKDDAPEPQQENSLRFDELKDDDANSDLEPADLQKKMFDRAYPNGPGKYETPGQQVATVAEGAAQGLFSFVAPWVEQDLLGVPAEDIAGRAAANPVEHGGAELAGLVAGTALPIGQGALIASFASKAVETTRLAGIGAMALKGAIEGAALYGSDKASQAILGQGNPADAVNPYLALGANVVLGGLIGGAGGKASEAAMALGEKHGMKIAAKAEMKLAKLGQDAESGALNKKVAEFVGGNVGAVAGSVMPFGGQYLGGKIGEKVVAPLVAMVTKRPSKYAGATVARWLTNGLQGSVFNMIDYANKVAKGESLINRSLDMLFKGAAEKGIESYPAGTEKLREYLESGGIDQNVQEELNAGAPDGLAEGGEVKPAKDRGGVHHDDHIAQNFPDQHVMLQAARARMSQYLNTQRPQKNMPKLPYGRAPDDRLAQKNYAKALETAVSPLAVMQHIKSGRIMPEHVQHLNALYPELAEHMRQKVTERITQDQLDGKKPPYVVRQGLSLFLGTPLSDDLTPQAIQAAQHVFASAAQAQQQQPAPQKSKRSTAPLSKSSQAFLTDDQAREQRQKKS